MPDPSLLEFFDNPHPSRPYLIVHQANEFTSVCPMTAQPDFGVIVIRYVADASCVELKGLKLYLQSYRNDGIFYEDVTNRILNDLVSGCSPRWMQIESRWTVRGGLHTIVYAEHGDPPPNLSQTHAAS
jgi:7-cyano-7-deazaguanine reductase